MGAEVRNANRHGQRSQAVDEPAVLRTAVLTTVTKRRFPS